MAEKITKMIVNIEFFQPGKDEQERLGRRLKYLQYRNDRDGHVPQKFGLERWVDCGLGDSWSAILRKAPQVAGTKVMMWSLIVSPNPMLLEDIPREQHQRLVHEITVRFLDEFFAERGVAVPPEFAFVVHHKDEVNGRAQPHAHVMIAGTYQNNFTRAPFVIRNQHLEMVREIANRIAEQTIEEYRHANRELLVEREPGIPSHFPPLQPQHVDDGRWQRPLRQMTMFGEDDDDAL